MSVLIKGMEMPEKCTECRMQTDEGFCSAMPKEFCGYVSDEKRSDWCPLVELPEKHGDLIDRDELIEILTTAIRTMKRIAGFIGAEDDPEIKMEIKAYTDVYDGVRKLLTVIESEGK